MKIIVSSTKKISFALLIKATDLLKWSKVKLLYMNRSTIFCLDSIIFRCLKSIFIVCKTLFILGGSRELVAAIAAAVRLYFSK